MPKRSITDDEIGLIKAMIHFGMKNKGIQFYFNRQDRAVNSGRITQIKDGTYGPNIEPSALDVVQAFMESFAAPSVNATPIKADIQTPKEINPLEEKLLKSFFSKTGKSEWVCNVGESEQHECKSGFSFRHFGKALRAIAGFANNKGGYLFFGVKDKPYNYLVCGLDDDRFGELDVSAFTKIIRSSLEPTPDFSIKQIYIGGLIVGVIHVKAHTSKPVIARKTEGDLAEGVIYYRYPGESRAISYPDLRSILDERDRQSRHAIIPMVERIIELGPQNALVANLADGLLEGGSRSILLDEKLLQKIKFIREGYFDENLGAEALKVVGNVSVVPEGTVQPTKTVREEITEISIIRNFVRLTVVEQPLAYFRQASHEPSWLLPVYYYLFQAGLSKNGAIAELTNYPNAKPKTRDELIRRLQGERSLFSKPGPRKSELVLLLREQKISKFDNIVEAKSICYAITSLEESDEKIFPYLHNLLDRALRLWEENMRDRTYLSAVRYAVGRLDELEYAARVAAT